MRYSHVHMVVAPKIGHSASLRFRLDRVGIRTCYVGVSGSASFDRHCGWMVVPTFAQAHNVAGSLLRLALVESRCAPADQRYEPSTPTRQLAQPEKRVWEDLACHEAA